VTVFVHRRGNGYIAQVEPPESKQIWKTDRPYPRDELRWKIEALGVHPIDVADAFEAADARAERAEKGPTKADIRVAEQRWPRDVPDRQHVADLMAGTDLTAAEAKLILDLARGDTTINKIRRRVFWLYVSNLFRWSPKKLP
jgi:hypothetical protein